MRKVLYLCTVSSTINAFLVPHIRMLLENNFLVGCACFINKPIDDFLIRSGVEVFDIPFCRKPLSIRNIKAFLQLIKIQRKNKYDIVHVHTPVASIYGRLLKLIFPKLKIIYTAHGYHFFKGGGKAGWIVYYPIEKIMAKLTDITININREDYEVTLNKLKPKNCFLISGVGLDLTKYMPLKKEDKIKIREELNFEKDDFLIIMIAELNKNKNQVQLIMAMEIIKNKYPKIKVLLVGEGDKLQELKNMVKIKSLEENVFFLGLRRDINELINASDIGILLSYREGLPRSIMELMAVGKKIIATNIRGNKDLVCSENIGTLVEAGDFEGTAKAIEIYYRNNNEEIMPRELEKYSLNNVLKELMAVYQKL